MEVGAVFDSVGQQLLMTAGRAGNDPAVATAEPHNDVWALSLPGNLTDATWHQLQPSISVFDKGSAIWDSANQRMITFGGVKLDQQMQVNAGEVWALVPSQTPAWQSLNATGTPPTPRYGHVAVYDSNLQQMLTFSGSAGNDLKALSLRALPAWTTLDAGGTPGTGEPAARVGASAVYDPVYGQIIVFGGLVNGATSSETWFRKTNVSGSGQWTAICSDTHVCAVPPDRMFASAFYTSSGMVLMGGTCAGTSDCSPNGSYVNDTWLLTIGNGTGQWTKVNSTAFGGTEVWDLANSRMLQFTQSGPAQNILSGGSWESTAICAALVGGGYAASSGAYFWPTYGTFGSGALSQAGLIVFGGFQPVIDNSAWVLNNRTPLPVSGPLCP